LIRKQNAHIQWLEFELLAEIPNLVHGVFLRRGGVSQDAYASLNVCRTTKDIPEHVEENRRRILKTLNLERLISAQQIHQTHIECVYEPKEEFSDCDGLMTSQNTWGLLIQHADCQAALFYDPIKKVIASIHAGWRGQVKNIYQTVILKMRTAFGSDPKDLLVCISPSLGPQNSEFKNYREEFPEIFWQFQIKPFYFDLWAIARFQLEQAGILSHHLEIAQIDTYAHPDDFYSYRREKAAGRREKITGCHATVIALQPLSDPLDA
jgi:polyphenol oxidase